MKKDDQSTLKPKLRFPEFRDEPGWREGRFAEIAELLQGYGFPERYQGQMTGEYPFYKVSDISKSLEIGKVYIEESVNYINESVLKELKAKAIPEGTTIFAKIGEAIRSNRRAITTRICLIDNNVAGIKRIKGRSTDLFVYFLMETISLIDYAGGVVPAVNKSTIEDILVRFPKIEEQQKIADCLTSLDELISAKRQKLDALKDHKKGLMQQLFPREGETVPRVRFPNFREDWNEANLGKLCDSILSGRDQRKTDGTFDLYGSTGIIGKTASPSYSGPHILVARVGANAGLLTKVNGLFGVTDNTLVVSLYPSISIDYVFYALRNINVNRLVFGSGQPLITGSILKNLRIFLPSYSEQQKISTCLSSIDDLITVQTQKLKDLITHKKGLMAQLFPVT